MAGQHTVRDLNQQALLQLLRRGDTYSRAQLARALGLTKATVSAIAADLLRQNLLVEQGMTAVGDRGGRPGATLALNPRGASFLGAECSESHVAVIALRLDGSEIGRERVELEPRPTLDTIMLELVRLVCLLRERYAEELPNLLGLGLAVPGMLSQDGTISWFPGLHWAPVRLAEKLERQLDLPVVVENDANASAMAELLLGEDDLPNILYLLLDLGVGSAIVVDRTLYRGSEGRSGEVGHMRLALDGPRCPHCGGTGCFESMVNSDAIERYFLESSTQRLHWRSVLSSIDSDEHSRQAFDRWTWWLARGLLNLAYVLNPSEIVLGGVVPHLAPGLVDNLEDRLHVDIAATGGTTSLRLSTFGEIQSAIGAAALVYQQVFTPAAFQPLHLPTPDRRDVAQVAVNT